MKYERIIRMKEEVELLKHEYKGFNREAYERLLSKFGEEDTHYFLKVAEVALPYRDSKYESAYDALMAGEEYMILLMPATSMLLDGEWVVPYYNAEEDKNRLYYRPVTLEEYAIEYKRGIWYRRDKIVCSNYLEARETYKKLHERFLELNNLKENDNG